MKIHFSWQKKSLQRNDKSGTEVASGNFSTSNFSVSCDDDDDDDDQGGVKHDDDDPAWGEINHSGMR